MLPMLWISRFLPVNTDNGLLLAVFFLLQDQKPDHSLVVVCKFFEGVGFFFADIAVMLGEILTH